MSRRAAPGPQATPPARSARVLVGVIGGLFLLLIAAFVGMIFFVQDEARLNAVGPIAAAPGAERGGVIFRGTANIWEVRGRLTQDAERRVSLAIDLIGPTGQPAPAELPLRLELEPVEGGGATMRLDHRPIRAGSLVASSTALQAGRWRLRIVLPEIAAVQEFRVEP